MLRLLIILLAALMVGCSTAAPPATETPPDPQQLIQEAAGKIRAADTFRIDVTEQGPDYSLYTEYATVFFRRAVAQYVAPGIMQATIRVIAGGLPLQIDVFSQGADQWYRAIWTGNLWFKQPFAPGFNPMTLIAQETGFQAAMDALIDLTYEGEGELENGTKVHSMAATAEGPDVAALLGGLIEPVGIVNVGVHIDSATGYPARFVVTEYNSPYAATPEFGEDAAPVVWTIDVYDINAAPELNIPEDVTAEATSPATSEATAEATEAAP